MKEQSILVLNRQWAGINPVQCGWQHCAPGHAFGPAVRDHYLLHYVTQGAGLFRGSHGEYTLSAGDMFVIRPGETTFYQADGQDPWRYIWIGFDCPAEFAPLLEEDTVHLPLAEGIFSALKTAGKLQTGRELFMCAKLYELLAHMARQAEAAPTPEDSIRQAVNYMETEYMRDISISGIAGMLKMNRSYFSTLFKRVMGVPPQKYLTQLRIEKAAGLMASNGFTASEAALAAGYADVFAFSRAFKKARGVSPTQYRARG